MVCGGDFASGMRIPIRLEYLSLQSDEAPFSAAPGLDTHRPWMDIHRSWMDIHPAKVDVHARSTGPPKWMSMLDGRVLAQVASHPCQVEDHKTAHVAPEIPTRVRTNTVATRKEPIPRAGSQVSTGGSVEGDGPHGPWSRASGRSGTSSSILTDDLGRITPLLSRCCDTACEPPGCRVGACSLASDSPPRSDVPLPPS